MLASWSPGDKLLKKWQGRWWVFQVKEAGNHGTILLKKLEALPETKIDPTGWNICIGQ